LLPSEKRALLEKLLQGGGVGSQASPSISRRCAPGPIPLSFAQQRLWFLKQMDPGNPVFNIHFAFRLSGALDIPLLERSFNRIIERHEILRTRFVSENGKPVQVVG